MQLKGSFEPSSLASILQMLYNDAKTGELQLTTQGNEVELFLREGNVIYAKGSQQDTRIGALLRSKGIITAQQLQDCLAKAKAENMAVGAALVNMGYITLDILKKVIRKQAEDAIYNVFLWEKGYFEYDDSVEMPSGVLTTRLDIMSIILEATRRIDEMSSLKKKIKSDKLIFKVSNKFKDKDKLKFNAVEWRFLSLIDGTRSVRQLINESGYEDFAVYKVLNSLISFGLIEKGQDIAVEATAPEIGYSAIVAVYTDILQEVCRSLHSELGSWMYAVFEDPDAIPVSRTPAHLKEIHQVHLLKWTGRIIDSCKPVIEPPEQDIFRTFFPGNPPDVFSHAVLEVMKSYTDAEKGREFLRNSFNKFTKNILEKMPDIAGIKPTRMLFWEIEKILRYVGKYQKDLVEKTDIITQMEDIFKNVKRKLENLKGVNQEAGKIFAIFIRDDYLEQKNIPVVEAIPLEEEQVEDEEEDVLSTRRELPDMPEDMDGFEFPEEQAALDVSSFSLPDELSLVEEPDSLMEEPDDELSIKNEESVVGDYFLDDDIPVLEESSESEVFPPVQDNGSATESTLSEEEKLARELALAAEETLSDD